MPFYCSTPLCFSISDQSVSHHGLYDRWGTVLPFEKVEEVHRTKGKIVCCPNCVGTGLLAQEKYHLQGSEAREHSDGSRRIPENHRLWAVKGSHLDGRKELYFLWYARIPGSRNLSEQRTRFHLRLVESRSSHLWNDVWSTTILLKRQTKDAGRPAAQGCHYEGLFYIGGSWFVTWPARNQSEGEVGQKRWLTDQVASLLQRPWLECLVCQEITDAV